MEEGMKKYIGTKQVEAEPMTMGEAYEKSLLQAGRVPNDSERSKAGYHVKYDNGYESWSPAEPFEKAYKLADTPLDRMNIEYSELMDRLFKLGYFVNSGEVFHSLDDVTKAMLLAQRAIMGDYANVLCKRITRMECGKGGFVRLSFGVAVSLLKHGFALRRSGWNGKNLFVIKQEYSHIGSDIIPDMQSFPQSAKDLILNSKGFIDYTSQCLIYNTETGQADSWTPSVSDVFACDWEVCLN